MTQSAIISQYDLVRGMTAAGAGAISADIASIVPDGFNNHILWNLGHVLTVQELMLFGPEAFAHIPPHYKELFGNGTKPADWTGDIPTLETIVLQLIEQPARIKAAFADRLDEALPKPFTMRSGAQVNTYGEMLVFSLFHEGMHVGAITALKRALTQQGK